MKLENGTLLKAYGNGVFGKCDRLVYFNAKYLRDKGYMLGSWLIPCEWLKLASESDYMKAITKASNDFNKVLNDLKEAYEKTKKVSKK